jgi:hypothetical protein
VSKQGGRAPAAPAGSGLGDLLGGMIGGGQTTGTGGLASLLDLDRDGNPLDDIIGMAGRYLR